MAVKDSLKVTIGAAYMFRAIRVVFSDWKVLRLAIMPMLINVLIFAGFFFSFNYFLYDWIYSAVFIETDQAWYLDAIYWLAGALLFIISLLVVFFGFVAIGLIVAAPFNDFLSAAVERKLTGEITETKMALMELVIFIVKNESKKIAIILAIQILIALISFIPGVGQIIFAILTPIFLGMVMAFEFTGYTLDRRGFTFADKKGYLKKRWGLSFGFGLTVAATLMVPILNFAILPLAVTGGTMLVVENPPEEHQGGDLKKDRSGDLIEASPAGSEKSASS